MNDKMFYQLANALFIVSPCIGYIPQLLQKNVVFSPLLSLILIFSAVFKFYFYQVESFSAVIIAQSAFLILIQLTLIYNFKSQYGHVEQNFYSKMERSCKKYGAFYVNLSLVVFVSLFVHLMTYFTNYVYHACGYLSLLLESSVGLLQIVMKRMDNKYLIGGKSNKRRMPKELFVCWIVGDFAKLYWMYKLESPYMLSGSVLFQIIVDFVLLFE
ncbi:hypothetical protein BDAP_001853 [Binucleata daphniae]